MQNKYLSALKTTYANFGFSKEALDRVALQRVKTIASEDEISADVANHDTLLLLMKEMQGATDSLRNEKARIQKELDDFKNTNGDGQKKSDDNPLAGEVAELKTLLQGMQSKLDESEKHARRESLLKDVHSKLKSIGCTNDYVRESTLERLEISETDTIESIAERMKPLYDANCKKVFGEGYVPPKGKSAGVGDDVDYGAMVKFLQESGSLPK